ncbi:MAG TPA: hypothetical protein VGK40_04830 [Verrucomicrobiae bacterium]|jgi:hypothetical protein
MKRNFIAMIFAAVFGAASLHAQAPVAPKASTKLSGNYQADATVLREAQEQALEMAQAMQERAENPKAQAALEAAVAQMERALKLIEEAGKSPQKLAAAVAAEQAAYAALLKLSMHEFEVSKSKKNGQSQSSANQPNQQQLNELDLKQTENRYETQRQAATPQQSAEQREQLQVQNRLKELAQRQQDMNEKLRELQNALQEAKTDAEKEEIRRRLKRLREEEQEMLADIDELQQKMAQSENQSKMAEARQQLDKTRGEVQKAAESLEKEAVPQALASGTRAQRELQQMRDDFRKKNSSQFSEDMRQMRSEARDLAQKQEDIGKKIEEQANSKRKTLSDSGAAKELADQLKQQKSTLTNLLDNMRNVTEKAEFVEPLLSKQLYDTLRKNSQGNTDQALAASEELLKQNFTPQASQFEQKARQDINELKQGVEKAAESVLGDDTEALKLARKELEDLSRQVENEIARNDAKRGQSSEQARNANQKGQPQSSANEKGDQSENGGQTAANQKGGQQGKDSPDGQNGQQQGKADQQGKPSDQAGPQGSPGQKGDQPSKQDGQQPGDQGQGEKSQGQQDGQKPGEQPGKQPGQKGQGQGQGQGQQNEQSKLDQQNQEQSQDAKGKGQGQGQGQGQGKPNQTPGQQPGSPQEQAANQQQGSPQQPAANPGRGRGQQRNMFDQQGHLGGGQQAGASSPDGPITGEDYKDWEDRLREVEELVDLPQIRTEVARIRERARAMRVEFKRHGKAPQWELVQSQVAGPLAEVRHRVGEELAKRLSNDALVPIDRDPVPNKFSDLVRRYYEKLGTE